jgi:hypothetical protein
LKSILSQLVSKTKQCQLPASVPKWNPTSIECIFLRQRNKASHHLACLNRIKKKALLHLQFIQWLRVFPNIDFWASWNESAMSGPADRLRAADAVPIRLTTTIDMEETWVRFL